MFKLVQDIECFQHKMEIMFDEALSTDSHAFDIYDLGKKIGLTGPEIESMYVHLKRGDLIERADDSGLLRFSRYAEMLRSGQIREAYAPI